MPYYKDLNNTVHFLDDDSYTNLLPGGSLEISEAEADILRTPVVDPADAIRASIASLENQFTDTIKMRAILGDQAARDEVQGILNQIDALKAQL